MIVTAMAPLMERCPECGYGEPAKARRERDALADISANRLQRLVTYGKQLQIVYTAAEKAGINDDLSATEYVHAYVAHAEALAERVKDLEGKS